MKKQNVKRRREKEPRASTETGGKKRPQGKGVPVDEHSPSQQANDRGTPLGQPEMDIDESQPQPMPPQRLITCPAVNVDGEKHPLPKPNPRRSVETQTGRERIEDVEERVRALEAVVKKNKADLQEMKERKQRQGQLAEEIQRCVDPHFSGLRNDNNEWRTHFHTMLRNISAMNSVVEDIQVSLDTQRVIAGSPAANRNVPAFAPASGVGTSQLFCPAAPPRRPGTPPRTPEAPRFRSQTQRPIPSFQ